MSTRLRPRSVLSTSNGKVVKIVTVRGGWKNLLAALRKIKHPFVICYEASCGYGALYDALRKIARRVVVAHPGQLRLIFRSKSKNDRSDAKKLATLLFLDQVPTVHVPGQDVRADKHPGVYLLRTITGVGARTAEAVMAYIDDPYRFARRKQVGAYFGWVPSQDRSANVNRLGHITREGPSTVRKRLTEAAWPGIRRGPHLKAYFERIRGDGVKRRKIAWVATAHYRVRVMHARLRTGETCRWETANHQAA